MDAGPGTAVAVGTTVGVGVQVTGSSPRAQGFLTSKKKKKATRLPYVWSLDWLPIDWRSTQRDTKCAGGGRGQATAYRYRARAEWQPGLLRLTHPPTHPPTSENCPRGKNEFYQRGPNWRSISRTQNFFFGLWPLSPAVYVKFATKPWPCGGGGGGRDPALAGRTVSTASKVARRDWTP